MLEKLKAIKNRWEDVEKQLSDPVTISDMKMFAKLNKEYKDLGIIVNAYHTYKKVIDDLASAKEVLMKEKEEEFRELAKSETNELSVQKEKLEEEIKNLLVPKDPEDSKNAVVEIRAGTGGDEASIFVGD